MSIYPCTVVQNTVHCECSAHSNIVFLLLLLLSFPTVTLQIPYSIIRPTPGPHKPVNYYRNIIFAPVSKTGTAEFFKFLDACRDTTRNTKKAFSDSQKRSLRPLLLIVAPSHFYLGGIRLRDCFFSSSPYYQFKPSPFSYSQFWDPPCCFSAAKGTPLPQWVFGNQGVGTTYKI